MRQLFTNIPSSKTEQEPHSPSPHPSFVPANPRSFRRTSRRRSIAYACTVSSFPLTVKETSHFARICEDSVIHFLARKGLRSLALRFHQKGQRKYPLEATESNGTE